MEIVNKMADKNNHLSFVEYDLADNGINFDAQASTKGIKDISRSNFAEYDETANLSAYEVFVEDSRIEANSGNLLLQLATANGKVHEFRLYSERHINQFLDGFSEVSARKLTGKTIEAYFDEKGIRGVSTYCYHESDDDYENNEIELSEEDDENLEEIVGNEESVISEGKSLVYKTKTGKPLTEQDRVVMKISKSMVLSKETLLEILEAQRNKVFDRMSLGDILSLKSDFVNAMREINEINQEHRALKKQDHPIFNGCLDYAAEIAQNYRALIGTDKGSE